MNFLSFVLLAAAVVMPQGVLPRERTRITIQNANSGEAAPNTNFEAGFSVGDMLNFHFFPGLQDYSTGMYSYAEAQMTYVINRPYYLEGNPRAAEFLSTAHYVRGMIFFYHAKGLTTKDLARADFEAAIRWNPRNFVAYQELSRVYSEFDFREQAVAVLNRLLALKPDPKIADEAREMLTKLESAPNP